MRVTLVRHGQTEDNYESIMQGRSNGLMNDSGRRQCDRLRKKLINEHFDYCYMSPLVRCVETAMILIGDRVEMIPDKRLIERDLGDLEGENRNLYDSNKYWDYELNSGDLGVERVQDLFKRCRDFLDYINDKYSDKSILIVTHDATYRAFRHLLLKHELNGNLHDEVIDNCACECFDV